MCSSQRPLDGADSSPKVDEGELRKFEANFHVALEFLRSLDVKDEGEYRSMVNGLEDSYTEVMDLIIEHFGLPEDWS